MNMKWKRAELFCTAMMLSAVCMSSIVQTLPCSGAEVNDEGYDISGFAYQWPEVFSKDDTVTITENSYKSHDVSITMKKVIEQPMTGDVDCDRDVTLTDAVLMCKCMAEVPGTDVSVLGLRNADCDRDDSLTVTDLVHLIRYLSGAIKGSEFLVVGEQLVYHIADVYIRTIDSFRSAFAKGTYPEYRSSQLARVKTMANENNALFAINADYVEARNTGIVRRNGVHYRDTKYRNEICVLYRNGVMDVISDAEYRALSQEQLDSIWQTSHFYAGLVKDDEVITGFSGTTAEVNPRSGIGYYEPGHYLFLQVDGRQDGYSVGLTMDEYARLFKSLGVHEAYNMDGGSSSEIVFNGETYNLPAPVHVGDTVHGRSSSDIFFICEPSQIPPDTAAIAWEESGGLAARE